MTIIDLCAKNIPREWQQIYAKALFHRGGYNQVNPGSIWLCRYGATYGDLKAMRNDLDPLFSYESSENSAVWLARSVRDADVYNTA